MASDAFTNTNGTALESHTAGSVTWAGVDTGVALGEIQSNAACADGSDYFSVSARASNSSADFSQVVFKAGSYPADSKAVHVRSGAAEKGYWLQVGGVTGDTVTSLTLYKGDGTYLTAVSGLSLSRLTDHTVAIKATTVSGSVEIRAWIDGTQLTFDDTNSDNDTNSQVFTDLAANTPITSGNPGFTCFFFDGIGPSNSGFDDWTDVEGAGAREITSISDATLTHGQIGVVANVTGYAASGKTVRICPSDNVNDAGAVSQTVTAQNGSSVTFTAVLNSFSFGTTLYVFVLDGGSTANANADGEPASRIVASATLNFTGTNNFKNKDGTPAANKTGMTFYIWRAPRPPSSGGTPDQIITSVSTNVSGERSQSINLGSLDHDDTVYGMLYGADGNDIYWCGEVLPDYA